MQTGAVLHPAFPAGGVHEGAAYGLRGDGEEVPTVVPPVGPVGWGEGEAAHLLPDHHHGQRPMWPDLADEMHMREVGPAINSPQNDGPKCLEAA